MAEPKRFRRGRRRGSRFGLGRSGLKKAWVGRIVPDSDENPIARRESRWLELLSEILVRVGFTHDIQYKEYTRRQKLLENSVATSVDWGRRK